ncbi:MAG: hypothetical protein K0V04_29965 [Deltaproteobacteria bacterium]|nr:hypothetical protein [Deltaproteobacteria bacterium]
MVVGVLARLSPCIVLLSSLGLGACDPEPAPSRVELDDVQRVLTEQVCARMFSCPCSQGTSFASIDECEEQAGLFQDQLDSIPMREQYQGLGLQYDPACLGKLVDFAAQLGCASDFEAPNADQCVRPCNYWVGTQQVGQSCEVQGSGVTDCAQGLRCQGGTCTDPCDPANDPARAQLGEDCWNVGCMEGLWCEPQEGICELRPAEDEPCPDGVCAEGLDCQPVDATDPASELRCRGPQGLGALCSGHAQCISGNCPAGVCEARPRAGEACAGVCGDGLDCVDQMCVRADAVVCYADTPFVG